MLLMQDDMRDVYRGGANVLEFLFQLEEAVLYLFFDVVRQGLLGADQLWVSWVGLVFHDPATCGAHRGLKLVDASVGHGLIFVLVDMGLLLWIDTVDSGARGVHLLLHALCPAPERVVRVLEAVHVRVAPLLVVVDVLVLEADFFVERLVCFMAKLAHLAVHEGLMLRQLH